MLPTPLRLTDCGLPVALSAKVRLALRVPLTAGVKVTPTTQAPLGATVAPAQVSLLIAKSLGFAPPIVTVETVRFAAPLLVTVSVCAALGAPTSWLPKSRLAAESVKAEAMPVPLTGMMCGLPAASSVIFTDAVRFPAAEGLKVTVAVQLAPGASRTSTRVGENKVRSMGTRHHDTGNIQSCGATIGQGDGPRRAGRAYGLAIERNGRATDRDAGC